MTRPADPHGRLAQPEQAIDGQTFEQLRTWVYAQLADNVPRDDLRYLAGTPTTGHLPWLRPHRFTPGDRLFGVLVV